MTNLKKELTELFTDQYKSEQMMDGDCHYNPKRPEYNFSYGKELTLSGVEFKKIKQYGGEDMGSDYWTVWEFQRGDEIVHFKFDGWYQSYDGAEFRSVYPVEPTQKTITVWK